MREVDKDFCSASPVIVFYLTKMEGEDDPKPSDLTEEERKDLKSICKFHLDFYDPDNNLDGAEIISYEILYNGIDYKDGCGVYVNKHSDEFEGYPEPLIRFHLNKSVNVWDFYQTVENSYLRVEPSEGGDWAWQDHNGYSRPVTPLSVAEFLYHFKLPEQSEKIFYKAY